jgi:solute carrier family 15 (oligopeptide transporter), member 1
VLFLHHKVGFDQDSSTAVYHFYVFFAYSFSILGSIIADSWLGQFRTLVWMSLVFSGGCFLVGVAAIDALNLPLM